jgi:hypothetical protein
MVFFSIIYRETEILYWEARDMADLKIRIFKRGETEPETTITIPGNILKIASKLVSHRLAEILQDSGIAAGRFIYCERGF